MCFLVGGFGSLVFCSLPFLFVGDGFGIVVGNGYEDSNWYSN